MRWLSGYLENENGAQAAIDVMTQYGLEGYRAAFYYQSTDGSLHGWRPEVIKYILDNSNKQVVIDRYHRYPYGTLTDSQFAEAERRLLEAAELFPDISRVWFEFTNEVTSSNLPQKTGHAVQALRDAGFYHRVIQDRWDNHTFSAFKQYVPDPDFYCGIHAYFNANSVSNSMARMQEALNAGLKVFNTEIGASYNEYTDYNTTNVGKLNDFLSQSEALGIENAVWMNTRVANWQRYKELNMLWTVNIIPSEPTPEPNPVPTPSTGNILPVTAYNVNAPAYARAELILDPTINDEAIAMYGERDVDGKYKPRELNSNWMPCAPGDLIILRGWMRSEPPTQPPQNASRGMRIGLNLMGPTAQHTTDHSDSGVLFITPDVPIGTVPYTLSEVEFTVPQTVTSFLNQEKFTPSGFIAWTQVATGVRNNATIEEMATAYFAALEGYVNPSAQVEPAPPYPWEPPEPTPPPAPACPLVVMQLPAKGLNFARAKIRPYLPFWTVKNYYKLGYWILNNGPTE